MKSENDSTTNNGVTYGAVAPPAVDATNWTPGYQFAWDQGNLSGTTRYLTHGSWTSAPSENLGFWFSGLRGADYEPVFYQVSAGESGVANTSATEFMTLNLSQYGDAESFNMTWPAVDPRAEGGLVWLPYGNKGMLLAFGGIVTPSDLQSAGISPVYDSSNDTNSYMTDILVYDVDSNTWTSQQTAGATPTQLASFCTVVASMPDNSSHHIYVYGGYDGTYMSNEGSQAFDDVWVLSIPAFRWTKLTPGDTSHRRQNHVCVKMNANTMLSIGGNVEYGSYLESNAFDVYDLNTGSWTHTYTPNATAAYSVPAAIASGIGDVTKIPDDLTSQVKEWLGAPYKKYDSIIGPLLEGCPASSPTPTPTPAPSHSSNGWKTPVAAAVASVGGVAILAGLLWCFCIRRRRRGSRSDDTKRNSILSWMNKSSGHPSAPKSMPDSENTVIATPVDYFGAKGSQVEAYEMPSNVPSPGYHSYGHGSPQIVAGGSTSPPHMGSAEVDAQSRHEIMDHVPRGSQSVGQSSYSPRFSNNPTSVRSDSVSHASDAVMHSRHYGFVAPTPYELAHDRSHEDLATPPADVNLGEPRVTEHKNASSHSLGVGADHVSSPAAMTPVAPISRNIDAAGATEADRPRHQRNQSSMSSNLPNLPSPGPEEDRRRSRLLETLPDVSSGQASPVQQQTAKRSIYKENLDS